MCDIIEQHMELNILGNPQEICITYLKKKTFFRENRFSQIM